VRRILLVILLVASTLTTVALTAAPAGADEYQFTLTTEYTGLYPSADVSVPVTVHNPEPYAIAVHTAAVLVGDANAGCPASNLIASSFSGDVVAPARGDAVVPIRMRMPRTAPDACQGATFPLVLTATGEPTGPMPAEPGAGSGFAFTGGDVTTSVIVGSASLLLGLALLVGRRRRADEVPS
jgi:LPXTG-motif cell wall-anchored protein